jgi:putative ABC transport system permease protein
MFRYLPLILKNVWRNRRRTLLTIASIGVSMCLLGVMAALYHAFYLSDPSPASALRVVTRNRISLTVALPRSYMARVKQVPGVQEVMQMNWFGGTYKDMREPKNNFARFGVEPDKLFTIFPEYQIPEDDKKAFQRERSSCIVGHDLAVAQGFKVGDRIHLMGDIYPGDFDFTIRGIFNSPSNSNLMYFDKEYIDQSLPERRRGQVGMIYEHIDNPASAARISNDIDELFRNSTAQTKTETEQAFAVGFLSFFGNVKMLLMGISAAVMFTILLVSANTMAMSVRERVREVGVLKTLGFSPGAVLNLILGEAAGISVAGGMFGYLISILLLAGMAKSPFGGFLPPFQPFSAPVAAVCIATAAIIGVSSALVPALSASRISIVAALRSTD